MTLGPSHVPPVFAAYRNNPIMRTLFDTPMRPFRLLRPLLPSLLVLVLLSAGLGLVMTGCTDGEASSESPSESRSSQAIRVETLLLEPTSFTDVIEVTGSVEALHDATLSAQTSGTVTMLAERGAYVEDGAPVARIDADEARAAVEQARAQYELAQDRFERQQPLYQDSIISALEFEQVRSERNQARAALQQAEKRLANTRVDAPFPGTVEERFVEAGEQVSPGIEVARIVNTERVRVTAGVPERYANDIREGSQVQIDGRRYNAGLHTADVTFAANTIDPDSRTFTIEATVSNEDGRLKPEMSVRIRVTREALEDVLVLPRTAVVRDETGTHVYVVERSDTATVAQVHTVRLGATAGEHVVADSGLSRGEEIITVGQNNVAPDTPVEVIEQHERPSGAAPDVNELEARPTPPSE